MRIRTLTSLVGSVLLTSTLFAQQPPRPVKPGAPGPVGRCMEVAGLSEAQKQQAKTIFEAAAPALRALNQQLHTDREALRTAMQAATPEACAVGTAMLKVRATEKALEAEHEKLRIAIEAILTPEQKLRFAGCMEALNDPKRP